MGKLDIRLLADRILVKVDDKGEDVTKGGIIIPESASKEAALTGKVLNVSTRVRDCEVKDDRVYEGETVIFSKYAGSDLSHSNNDYKVLRITDVFGVLGNG